MLRWLNGFASLGVVLIALAGSISACSNSNSNGPTEDASPGAGQDASTTGTLADGGDASVADGSTVDATTQSDGSTGDGSTADAAPSADSSTDAATDGATADATVSDGAAGDGASPDGGTVAATGLVNARTVPVTPATPLAVASGAMLPAAGATGVPVDTILRIGFDAAPTLGATGTISIHQVSDGSIVDTINIADPYAIYDGTPGRLTTNQTSSKVNLIGGLHSGIDQVRVVNYVPITISGNTATIYPHNNMLAYATKYYVTIDAGLLVGNVASTAFAGITDATTWTFTTKAAAPTTFNVAADDSADFATVQGAIDAIAAGSSTATTINIAPGVYQELLFVRNKKNITFQGSNNGLGTVIQYENFDGFNPGVGGGQAITTPGPGGTIPGYGGTVAGNLVGGGRPVMLAVGATGLVLDSITIMNLHPQGSRVVPTLPASTTIAAGATTSATFVNYASPVTPAEALYFNISFSATTPPGTLVAEHSNFISYQDTLQLKGFAWFYDDFVTGDTDFIWGNANAALFERCEIKSRLNPNGSSVVQSRAYLGFGDAGTPSDFNTSYPGFVFLDSALTKEDGTFTAYLARSPGAATTSGTAPIFYLNYDIVSYVGCTMDSHIAPVGWNVSGSNPPGANVRPNPVVGWREYRSLAPDGGPLDVSQRLVDPSPTGTTAASGGSLQLTDANAATFFANRIAILQGATDGTFTTTGLSTFAPTP